MFRKFFLVLSLAFAAFAFSFSSRNSRSTSLKMNFEDAIGAQPPLGFWDPLGEIILQHSIPLNLHLIFPPFRYIRTACRLRAFKRC